MGPSEPTTLGDRPRPEEWEGIATSFGWSKRECEIVRRILGCEARKGVASSLGITHSTVQTHLQRAIWKAHANELMQLMWKVVGVRDQLRGRGPAETPHPSAPRPGTT